MSITAKVVRQTGCSDSNSFGPEVTIASQGLINEGPTLTNLKSNGADFLIAIEQMPCVWMPCIIECRIGRDIDDAKENEHIFYPCVVLRSNPVNCDLKML